MPKSRRRSPSKKATTEPASGRGRGRPLGGDTVSTPAVLERIATLKLQGQSTRQIAEALGTTERTVARDLKLHIWPVWREQMGSDLAFEMAKVDHLERVAWECFYADKPAETRRELEESLRDEDDPPSLKLTRRMLKTISRPGAVAWLDVVQWCIDYRAKVAGHYRPDPARGHPVTEFRVAGATLDQVDQEMVDRLLVLVEERKTVLALQRLRERDPGVQ